MLPILFIMSFAVAVVISTSLLVILFYNLRPLTKLKELLSAFSKAADEFKLSISKKEILGNNIIGLDESNYKLLFVKRSNSKNEAIFIDLQDIKSSTIKQKFESKKDNRAEVRSISLQLNIKNSLDTIILPFYDNKTDPKSELSDRSERVIDWQTLISIMLTKTISSASNQMKTIDKFSTIVKNIA